MNDGTWPTPGGSCAQNGLPDFSFREFLSGVGEVKISWPAADDPFRTLKVQMLQRLHLDAMTSGHRAGTFVLGLGET